MIRDGFKNANKRTRGGDPFREDCSELVLQPILQCHSGHHSGPCFPQAAASCLLADISPAVSVPGPHRWREAAHAQHSHRQGPGAVLHIPLKSDAEDVQKPLPGPCQASPSHQVCSAGTQEAKSCLPMLKKSFGWEMM